MAKGDPLLVVQNLRAYYPSKKGLVRAVDGISFEVREGECLGIIGESGSGKSSLALAVIGLFDRVARFRAGTENVPGLVKEFDKDRDERPGVSGKVFFRDIELTALPEDELVKIRGRHIAMIPQGMQRALNPQYSIGYQTGEPIAAHEDDVRLTELRRKVLEYLGLVHLADAETRYVMDPSSFSGGEAQRILIAMSLIGGPELVIADEPTSALDVTIQRQIMNVLSMVRDEFNLSLILISHDAGVVAELADRVAVMYAGRFLELGEARQMFLEPGHPYTRGLMSSFPTIAMMRMRAGKGRPRLRGIPGDPPDLTDIPPGCPFHPRCEYATEVCRNEVPDFREVEPGHFIMCHRYEELDDER